MKTPLEHLELALGENMNIRTLKPIAFAEIMEDYAKYYHKKQLATNENYRQIKYFDKLIQSKLRQLPRALKGNAPKEVLEQILQEMEWLQEAKEHFELIDE